MHRSVFMKGPAILVLVLLLGACGTEPGGSGDAKGWPNGLQVPIPGATFPLAAEHLPGGARDGLPGGFEFVAGAIGTPTFADTAAVAVAPGTVVRVVRSAEPLTEEERAFVAARAAEGGNLAEQALDRLRGRQVWIEHADGTVSRYARLAEVRESLKLGQPVEAGATLGRVAGSGSSEEQPAEDSPVLLHFELLNPAGRSLGEGLAPLETHARVAQVFGEGALPRFGREAVAAIEEGAPVPEPYPPEPLPDTGLTVDVPETVPGGTARAVAVTWEGDDFAMDALIANLNGLTLGFVDAGNGAWLLLPAPRVEQALQANLTVGGSDRYGRTLIGQRSIAIEPGEDAAPLEVDASVFERYSDENLQPEGRLLSEAASASLAIRDPLWRQPFRAPAEGRVVREFGQAIVAGMLRPAFPNPGIDIRAEGETGVAASNAGRVALVETLPIRGRTVAVVHGGGLVSVYSGLEVAAVVAGQKVERGQVLGSVGSTESNRQFRWEMHLAGVPTDPRLWLDRVLPPKNQ